MKYGALNTKTGELNLFVCKIDLAKLVGVTTKTVSRWQETKKVKQKGHFLICFDVVMNGASQKARAGALNNLRKGNPRI